MNDNVAVREGRAFVQPDRQYRITWRAVNESEFQQPEAAIFSAVRISQRFTRDVIRLALRTHSAIAAMKRINDAKVSLM
jgi:hypothetical protein